MADGEAAPAHPAHGAKKVILAGGRGFLGQALGRALAAEGWEVVVLSRDPRDGTPFREVLWSGETGGAWAAELEGADALVNLAGRSINCVHTLENSRDILESRVKSVRALGKGYARTKNPPPVWVQCSATGFYGNAGDRFCEEPLPSGPGFPCRGLPPVGRGLCGGRAGRRAARGVAHRPGAR